MKTNFLNEDEDCFLNSRGELIRKKRGGRETTGASPHQNKALLGGRRDKAIQREKKKRSRVESRDSAPSVSRPEMTHSAHCHC